MPIRLFHWTFAGSLATALAIGFLMFTLVPLLAASGAGWLGSLFPNHESRTETLKLPILSTMIQLGEYEGAEHGGEHEDDDDD